MVIQLKLREILKIQGFFVNTDCNKILYIYKHSYKYYLG